MHPDLRWFILTGFVPLLLIWRSCAGSTIRHALGWAVAAWVGWCLATLAGGFVWTYLALCLTACAGIAVLGARRPGAGAWHFVVVGLLITLLLPLANGRGQLRLPHEYAFFLAAVLLVGLGNYLPTRQFLPSLLALLGCGLELLSLAGDREALGPEWILVAGAPWAGWIFGLAPRSLTGADVLWWRFRNRFGFLWSERMRDQFNRSAENANLGATLQRGGLVVHSTAPEVYARSERLLRSLLQRFDISGNSDHSGSGG